MFDPIPEGVEDDRIFSPAAFLPAPEADPAAAVEADDWSNDAHSRMYRALETLDDRSRDILDSRWLTEEKQTLHELAEKYGVSAERIRQIEKNAMKKVREQMLSS